MEEMNRSTQMSAGLKKPYTKPELMRVGLRPEEAVLGVCKASGGTVGGGTGGTCSTVSCQDAGS